MRSSTLALCLSGALVSRTDGFLLLKKQKGFSDSFGKKKQDQQEDVGGDELAAEDDDLAAEEPQPTKEGTCAQKIADEIAKGGCPQDATKTTLVPETEEESRDQYCTAKMNEIPECKGATYTGPLGVNIKCGEEEIAGTADTTLGLLCGKEDDSERTAEIHAAKCGQKMMDMFCEMAEQPEAFLQAEQVGEDAEEEDAEAEPTGPFPIGQLFDDGSKYDFKKELSCKEAIDKACGDEGAEAFIQNDHQHDVFTPDSHMYPEGGWTGEDKHATLKCGDVEYTYVRGALLKNLCPAEKGSSGSR